MANKKGLSQRAYAKRRGVSHTAVQKAIADGRIKVLPDGSIDPKKADKEWEANTDETKPLNSVSGNPKHRRNGGAPVPGANAVGAKGDDEDPEKIVGTTYQRARAARETYQAKLARLEYEHKMGKLVDAAEVRVAAFNAARNARDTLRNLPDRIAAQFPDIQHELHRILLEEVHRVCRELANQNSD